MEEPLQLRVELQGDSLRAPPGPAKDLVELRVLAALMHSNTARAEAYDSRPSPEQLVTCSACGCHTSTLRKCAACKQAQYCRWAIDAWLCMRQVMRLIACCALIAC